MNVDAYALKGAWAQATAKIVQMLDTGVAFDDELPDPPRPPTGVEKYARLVCESNPRADIGIVYGLCAVAVCVAAQGAIIAKCPVSESADELTVPTVQQFLGVAPSGWRKSTALGLVSGPLMRALERGVMARRQMSNEILTAARESNRTANAGVIDWAPDDKQFNMVFSAGHCPHTVVQDPTVESLRNMAVYNGGITAVLAGEADVFRNITAYSSDSGSLTFFLDLWDQGSIATSRVGAGMLEMNNAALMLAVLFQTDVFAEVTSGNSGRGGSGADSFMLRGAFGRMLVAETDRLSGFADIAATYADDAVHSTEGNELSLLSLAAAEFEAALHRLVEQTNEYRMYKAMNAAWGAASTKFGADLQVPYIDAIDRTELRLSPSATVAYNRLQRMYNALEEALSEMDEDAQIMWGPLVSRYVQHVMREALVTTLSSGRTDITADDITDSATRLIPWRFARHVAALSKRQHDRVSDILAATTWDNPRGEDRTPEGRVLAALSRMAKDRPETRAEGYTLDAVVRKVTSMMNRSVRGGVKGVVERSVMNLVSESESGITAKYTLNADGSKTCRYVIAESAVQYS